MRDLLKDRLQNIILLAIAVLALFIVAAQFTKSSGEGGAEALTPQAQAPSAQPAPAAAKKSKIGSLVTGAPGSDSAAQQILRTGAIALESYFAEHGSFEGAAAALPGVEPNVTWTSEAAQAAANQVAVTTDAAGYTLATTSASGATYSYARDASAHIVRSCGAGCTW